MTQGFGKRLACAILFSFTLCRAGAQVSSTGAALEGTVRDGSGAVVPHATVTITNDLTNQTRFETTDQRGTFRATQLSVGVYDVSLRQQGFAAYERKNVNLSLGQTTELQITLSPPSASEQVTVNAQTTGLDVSQTSVLSSIDQERIEELPVRTRNYLDFVLLAPGVSSAPASSAAIGSSPSIGSGFIFGGLRPQSNNLLIDGLDNNDEFTGSSRTELSPEIVQEFQVVNNGLSAESGGASGGSINVVTRSGTNIVHGDAFIFAQDSAFNAKEPFETEAQKPSIRHYRAGFALGGPIIKDKTFYYAAAEQEHNRGQIGSDVDPAVASQINSFFAAGSFPGLKTRQITTSFSPTARAETETAGRLDQQLTSNASLMVRYAFTNNKEAGDAFNAGGLFDSSARGSTFLSDNGLSASLTSVLGSNTVSDLRIQLVTRRAVLRTNDPFGPEIDIPGLLTLGRPYTGNSRRRENHCEGTYTFTRTSGRHLWKFGGTANRIRERADVPDGFGGVYLFASPADFLRGDPDQFRQAFGDPRVDFSITNYGAFVQDHWSATRQLAVDLGVRYDFESLPAGFNENTANFSPRVGVAWHPFTKWVFRAGYGVFFDRYILANLTRAIDGGGSQGFQQVADGTLATALFAGTQRRAQPFPAPGIAPSIFRPDPNMRTPYSLQASGGAEYLLGSNMKVRTDYLFVHGVRLSKTVNVNLMPPAVLTLANSTFLEVPDPAPQQIGRDVFSPGRVNQRWNDIYELQDSGNSTYNGISVALTRTLNEDLEFTAAYTLSKTYDDASNYDEQPQNPYDIAAESAISRQNQHQRFVFNALWELPIGDEESNTSQRRHGFLYDTVSHIEFASIVTAESGRPVDPLTGVDSEISHAFPLSSRPLGFSRNSVHTPAIVSLDLRVLKYFPFGKTRHLDVVAESFNLLNRANVSQINPVFGSNFDPNPGFGQPTLGLVARQIQFSLDFEF